VPITGKNPRSFSVCYTLAVVFVCRLTVRRVVNAEFNIASIAIFTAILFHYCQWHWYTFRCILAILSAILFLRRHFQPRVHHIWMSDSLPCIICIMSQKRPCFIYFVVWPTTSLKYDSLVIFYFYQQFGEQSCVCSTPFARWRCNIRRLHSNVLKCKFLL